jgi:HPt (histidine-containing phosphotransfer) domain-containing protein
MPDSAGEFHRSTLAGHPDVGPVLPMFVRRLPGHVQGLHAAHAGGNSKELLRIVHQLRGAGRSFGFAPITAYAAAVEELLRAVRPLPEIAPALERLIDYIEHVEGYGVANG